MNISRYLVWCREMSPRRRILLACCLVGMYVDEAFGSGTILSTGFDDYTNGALAGQHGWLSAGFGPSSGPGASTATVQNAAPSGKVLTVTRAAAANGDRRWAKPVSGFPSQRFVTIDWDMSVSQPSPLTAYGPFFGVDAYDADVAPYVLGALGVDASTGDVMYQVQDTGYLDVTGATVGFNVWNHFRIILDFATDTYSGYVNGNLVATTGFVDRAFGLNNFTDADIATFASNGDPQSQSMSSSALFDNFVIRDGLVGDYDVEGDVDEFDYLRWRETFGSSVPVAGNLADGSRNSIVDAADYVVWRKHLGEDLFPDIGASHTAVPEPTTSIGLLLCIALMPRTTHRQPGTLSRSSTTMESTRE